MERYLASRTWHVHLDPQVQVSPRGPGPALCMETGLAHIRDAPYGNSIPHIGAGSLGQTSPDAYSDHHRVPGTTSPWGQRLRISQVAHRCGPGLAEHAAHGRGCALADGCSFGLSAGSRCLQTAVCGGAAQTGKILLGKRCLGLWVPCTVATEMRVWGLCGQPTRPLVQRAGTNLDPSDPPGRCSPPPTAVVLCPWQEASAG